MEWAFAAAVVVIVGTLANRALSVAWRALGLLDEERKQQLGQNVTQSIARRRRA